MYVFMRVCQHCCIVILSISIIGDEYSYFHFLSLLASVIRQNTRAHAYTQKEERHVVVDGFLVARRRHRHKISPVDEQPTNARRDERGFFRRRATTTTTTEEQIVKRREEESR